MENLVNFLIPYGFWTIILVIILILLIQDPDRAYKLKIFIIEPFHYLFKWFSKGYISSKVSSNANQFLNGISIKLINSEKCSVKVKWVTTPQDPILEQNGTLILRLKDENDQTKNILSAVHAALPSIICPLFRSNINKTCEKAIDLTILKRLSEQLGRHGKITFNRYFLEPETFNDITINGLLNKLVTLDKKGIFVPIFLNELELLSEGLLADADRNDYSQEVIAFIEYLLTIANREIGAEIELQFFTQPFKVSTILLARASRADSQGLRPYLNRLEINLNDGSDSIYIIAFPPAFDFFEKLITALDSHEKVFVKKIIKSHNTNGENFSFYNYKIAVITRNDIYIDEDFEQRLIANEIKENVLMRGIVEYVSHNESLVNVNGLRAFIQRKECSWISSYGCEDILKEGKEYTFLVKRIDKKAAVLYLTLRLPEANPYVKFNDIKVGDILEIEVLKFEGSRYSGIYMNELEVFIDQNEISWYNLNISQFLDNIGKLLKVKVLSKNDEQNEIYCSIRNLSSDPWPLIHKSLPLGKPMNGKVSFICPDYVQVMLPNNYIGTLDKSVLVKAGHEYAKFEENMVLGQGVDVVVTKVFIIKKKIRLDLQRNFAQK